MGWCCVRHGLQHISSRELTEWVAYDRLEPIGHERLERAIAINTSTLANVNRDTKKRNEPFSEKDFTPDYEGAVRDYLDEIWQDDPDDPWGEGDSGTSTLLPGDTYISPTTGERKRVQTPQQMLTIVKMLNEGFRGRVIADPNVPDSELFAEPSERPLQ